MDKVLETDVAGDRPRVQRDLVKGYFTAARAEKLRPRAQEITAELLADMVAAEPPVDLVEALALPLPLAVISDVLGISRDEQGQFSDWARAFLGLGTTPRVNGGAAGVMASAAIYHYMQLGIADHRARPDDSLLATLASADDPAIDDHARVLLAIHALVAGVETITNAIAGQVSTLLYHRPRLTFGCAPHHCPGQQLVRMEVQVALDGLVMHFPDLRPAVAESELRWKCPAKSGLRELPVTWGTS